MTRAAWLRERASRGVAAYLAVQAGLAAAFFALPTGLGPCLALLLAALVAAVTVAQATQYRRPPRAHSWQGLAVALLLSGLGWSWACGHPRLGGTTAPTAVADGLFLASYVVGGVAMITMAGLRRRGDLIAVLDAAVLAIGLGVLLWVVVSEQPAATQLSTSARLWAMAFPVTDAVLLAVAARLAFAGVGGRRILFLVAWAGMQTLADITYVIQVFQGTFQFGSPLFVFWFAGYAAIGAASLLTHRPPTLRRTVRTYRFGIAVIAVAVAPLPALLVIRAAQGSAADVALVAIATVAVSGLVLVRGVIAAGQSSLPGVRTAVRRTSARYVSGGLVLGLLPLTGLTYVALHESGIAARDAVRERISVSAAVVSEYVQEEMDAVGTLVTSYATAPSLVGAVSGPGAPRLDIAGQRLASLAAAEPDIAAAALLDTSGRLLAIQPPAPGLIGRLTADADYLRLVGSSQAALVSDPLLIGVVGDAVHSVAVGHTVRDQWGRVAGVLVAEYRFTGIQSFCDRLANLQGVTVLLADQHGHVVAGRGSGGPVRALADDERITAALAGRSATVAGRGIDGPSTSSYRRVPSLGWAVLSEQADRVAYRQQRRLEARVIAAAVLLAQILLAGLVWAVLAESRRRKAEAQLVDREEHLRGVLEAASDAYVSMDADGMVLAWNARATEIFGHDRETAIGAELADLVIPPELRAAHRAGLRRVLRGGRSTILGERVSVEALHADGHRFPIEIALWQNSSSGPPSFNAFLRDETARRQHEEQLAAARDAAVAASRMKSEFVANMSHEIRTPMNGVLGMTSLLRDTDLDAIQQDYADTIANCAEALLTIIDDILDFSKIEAGKLELEAVDFELRGIVEDVVGLLGAGARVRGVEMIALIAPAVPSTVHGDPHRLRQVLTNLVGNAVKYTEQGEIVVQVEPSASGHPFLHFTVRDTGIGITAEQRIRLFDAFEQADASMTRRFGGTGLGLTISRRLVHLMGGSLGVDSTAGQGSTFFFDVPLPTAALTLAADPTRRRSLAGVRALVVDDNPTNRAVLQHHLTSGSLVPTLLADPLEALAHLRAAAATDEPFQVVLLDMEMPGMTGLDLARAVQEDEAVAGTPLLMLTSSNLSGERAAAEAAGVRGLMTKPVRQEHLLTRLAQILDDHAEEQEADWPGHPSPAAEAAAAPSPDHFPAGLTAESDEDWRATTVVRARVLVAEDNEVNRRVVSGMLRVLGYEADIAEDGQIAIDKALSGDYAAILMDLQMPRVDGFEATRRIRSADSPRAGVPIVALTASALASDQAECRAAGMDDFLSKPLRRDKLASILRQWSAAVVDPLYPDEAYVPDLAGAHPAGAHPGEANPVEADPTGAQPAQPKEQPPAQREATGPAVTGPRAGEPIATEPTASQPTASPDTDGEPPATEPRTGEATASHHTNGERPATESPATGSPTTGLPAMAPPAPEAPATEAPSVAAPVSEPPTTRPEAAESPVTGPAAPRPSPTLPGVTPPPADSLGRSTPAPATGDAAADPGSPATEDPAVPVETRADEPHPHEHLPAGPRPDDDVLDHGVFADLVTLGPEMVTSLVATYLDTAPDRLAGLKNAVQAADLATVARLAHALKGSSAAMAAHHLAAVCADIERAAMYGAGTVPELIAKADAEYARVVGALSAHVPVIPTQKIRAPDQLAGERSGARAASDDSEPDW